jgi:hypothetical protein
MVKRYGNLYPHIVTFENLYTAFRKIVAAISKSRDPRHRLPHGAISKSHRGPRKMREMDFAATGTAQTRLVIMERS